jgi:hypothetical protein
MRDGYQIGIRKTRWRIGLLSQFKHGIGLCSFPPDFCHILRFFTTLKEIAATCVSIDEVREEIAPIGGTIAMDDQC